MVILNATTAGPGSVLLQLVTYSARNAVPTIPSAMSV